jgi:putative membrane protein insertion efficiency factor
MRKWLACPLVLLVKIYQYTISPLLGPACRYTPTCSEITPFKRLRKYGPLKGSWKALRRVVVTHGAAMGMIH